MIVCRAYRLWRARAYSCRPGAPFMLQPKSIRPLLALTSGGMTNILHDLKHRGLIERRPDPPDRRGVLIRLTAQGMKSIAAAIEAHVLEEHRAA
jgi:DNA-binding MarR family transcriptional regulator